MGIQNKVEVVWTRLECIKRGFHKGVHQSEKVVKEEEKHGVMKSKGSQLKRRGDLEETESSRK